MSVRTSSRTTKGRNKYMQSIMQEEEQLYQQQLGGSNTQSGSGMPQQENEQKGDDDDDYGEGSVRCPVCGTTDENYDPSTDTRGDMVQCDGCDMWQHIRLSLIHI